MITNKYTWFLKIILKAPLPYGYSWEKAPGGKTVYYNELTGEMSPIHPLGSFFRKTFAKILVGEKAYRFAGLVEKIVTDEVTKVSVINRVSVLCRF